MTIGQFKIDAIAQLKKTSPSAQLDVEVFLQYELNFSKTDLLLKRDKELSASELEWLTDAVEKRKTGLPVAYITGQKEFYGYNFIVTPAVLIPKPDTEILVERAIELILEKMEAHPDKILTVCDMCTGSGCIALSALRTLRDVYNISESRLPLFTLVDISPAALEIAEKNADFLKVPADRVRFVRSNLFEQFTYDGGWSFDLILTNPPYIPHSMVEELLQDGRKEPRLALNGDVSKTGDSACDEEGNLLDDGLEIIRNLLTQAQTHLCPNGILLMEAGEYNIEKAGQIALQKGFKHSEIINDLSGQKRVLEIN